MMIPPDQPGAPTEQTDHGPVREAALLAVTQVAQILNVAERSIWRWSDAGLMPPPISLGRSKRWRWEEDLKPWIAAGCPRVRGRKGAGNG